MTDQRCRNCGQIIPAEALNGQCPTCLLNLALESEDAGETDTFETGALEIPETVGPYRLVRELGRGGMGLVFLAEQVDPIRRLVALKVIKPGIDSSRVLARFEAERQALAMLQHPGIATIFDAGATRDGLPFFAMEYVPGRSITRYCDEHRLAIGQRVELFLQVCAAITHAHQKGIIHRDIKPSNLLVTEHNGQPLVKVIDFGIAKATSERLSPRTRFTQYGAIIGTPEYMSPEQAGATDYDVDTRTDIYSLGVVLYELLAGVRPFEADELRAAALAEVLRVIRDVAPPRLNARFSGMTPPAAVEIASQRQADVRSLARQLRGDLEWITLRSLEKEPAQRYPSVSELGSDLRRFLLDEPVSAGPPRLPYRLRKFVRRHRIAVAALIVAFTAVTVGLVVSLVSYARSRDALALAQRRSYAASISAAFLSVEASAADEAITRLHETDPSLRGWEWRHLYLAADTSIDRFGDGSTVRAINFDRDGHHIVWDAVARLFSFELASRREVLSATISGKLLGRSHDGHRAIFVQMPLNEVGPRRFTPGLPEIRDLHSGDVIATLTEEVLFAHPTLVSPDGGRIVVGNLRVPGQVMLLDGKNGREIARLTAPPAEEDDAIASRRRLAGFAFSADGARLAACRDSTLRLWDTTTGQELATTRADAAPTPASRLRTEEQPAQAPSSNVRTLAGGSAGDGDVVSATLAFIRDDTRLLCFDARDVFSEWDAATGRALAAWQAKRHGKLLAVSPDGARIAWAIGERIRITDAGTADVHADLVGHGIEVRAAAFSPDGRRLASGALFGPVRLWDTNRNRAVTTRRSDAPIVTNVAFHPNGRQIVAANAVPAIELWDVDSGNLRTFADRRAPIVAVAMASEGEMLVSGAHDGTIHRWNLIEGRPVQTMRDSEGGVLQAMALEGRGRLLASSAQNSEVCIWNPVSGTLISRLKHSGRSVRRLAFSPDGSRLAGADETGVIIVWDTRTWQRLSRRLVHPNEAPAIAFSPDSTHVAVATSTGGIWILEASSGVVRERLMAHQGGVTSLAYSPNGRRLVSGGSEATVRVWDALNWEPLLTLRHRGPIRSVAFSQDGLRIGASSTSGVIQVWNTLPAGERGSDRR
jgi:serine/threonine protein kinase/WD40 repeat protein